MLNFKEFIEKALEENGVQNDEKDVWVEVEGEQYTTSVESVLEREEQEPFEASYALENNLEHEAWEELYDSYKENYKADKGGRKMKTLSYINGKEQEIKIGAELYFVRFGTEKMEMANSFWKTDVLVRTAKMLLRLR